MATGCEDRSKRTGQVNELCSSQNEMPEMIESSRIERNDTDSAQEQQAEIIVVGGNHDKTVEAFNMTTKTWRIFSRTKKCRRGASSVLYQGRIILTGGESFDDLSMDSVEELNIARQDLYWVESQFKLPFRLQNHACVVYENRLLVIGGYYSFFSYYVFPPIYDSIYEIQLTPPYTPKLLTKMPRSIVCHGSEIVNNKLYIFGGSTSQYERNAIDNVLMFDPESYNFIELQSLPYAVSKMATVSWKDYVVVLGGKTKAMPVLDTVILYNVTNGSHRMLPSMKKKRYGCTAVIIGNDIVVMGGLDEHFKPVNSVECYNFDTNTWTELPAMIKEREFATAVVKYC